MKIQFISSLVVFLLFFVNVETIVAATGPSDDDLRAQASQALARDRQVTVQLKNEAVYKGRVIEVLKDSFKVQTSGAQLTHEINFADVASIKEQGVFASGMKKFGKGIGFIFTTRIGLSLLGASLTVARLIVYSNRTKRPKDISLTRID
jgi:hypothetical protein